MLHIIFIEGNGTEKKAPAELGQTILEVARAAVPTVWYPKRTNEQTNKNMKTMFGYLGYVWQSGHFH